jgi:hypothetical protein
MKTQFTFTQGLCIRCNKYINTKYDVAVTKPMNGSNDQNGIARYQGSPTYPAGNLFTNTDAYTYPSFCNYYNIQSYSFTTGSPYIITYYHHIKTGQYYTIPNLRKNVTLVPTGMPYSPDTTCASHLNGGISPPSEKMAQNDNFAAEKENELVALVDGGETIEMVSEVVYSYPGEALELRDQLLQQSPYLSDTVMKSAIEKETVINNAIVRDVLVANPQSAKSADLMQKLDERWEPMPDYMRDEIAEGATIVSPKEQLEVDIIMAKAEAEGWYNRLIGETLHDTASYSEESLTSILEMRQRAANDYMKAMSTIEKGDSETGMGQLEAIPLQYGFNEQQLAEHNLLTEYYELITDAQLNTRPVQDIDSVVASTLGNYIIDKNLLSNNWVRNMVLASGRTNFEEVYILPDLTKSADVEIPQNKKKNTTNEFLRVFPNPAKEFIIIEYIIGKAESNVILITDGMGRPVDKLKIMKEADQMLYITKNLMPGLYNCSLSNDGKIKSSVKFTVIR